MKRFIVGLLCGIALSWVSVAVAAVSNEVKTILFPTNLRFYIDGQESTAGKEDISVLNYENRIYIPLRAFAEKLGSTVDYRAPLPGETMASVDIYKVDDRDLEVRDADGYVGIGHVSVQFAEHPTYEVPAPSIKGAIKFYKKIPQGKQVVLEILDQDNRQAAVTEPIRLLYRSVGDMAAGEAATFETKFPYMPQIEGYQLRVRIENETPWIYEQIEGVLTGAGGMYGNPLGMGLTAMHEVKKGQPVELKVQLVNLSDRDTVVLSQPVTFEVRVNKVSPDGAQQLIRTLQTEPLTGTFSKMQGGAFTKLVWDQKDEEGRAVSGGEYLVNIVLPKRVVGATINNPDLTQEFTIESSMRTQFPVIIQ